MIWWEFSFHVFCINCWFLHNWYFCHTLYCCTTLAKWASLSAKLDILWLYSPFSYKLISITPWAKSDLWIRPDNYPELSFLLNIFAIGPVGLSNDDWYKLSRIKQVLSFWTVNKLQNVVSIFDTKILHWLSQKDSEYKKNCFHLENKLLLFSRINACCLVNIILSWM